MAYESRGRPDGRSSITIQVIWIMAEYRFSDIIGCGSFRNLSLYIWMSPSMSSISITPQIWIPLPGKNCRG